MYSSLAQNVCSEVADEDLLLLEHLLIALVDGESAYRHENELFLTGSILMLRYKQTDADGPVRDPISSSTNVAPGSGAKSGVAA